MIQHFGSNGHRMGTAGSPGQRLGDVVDPRACAGPVKVYVRNGKRLKKPEIIDPFEAGESAMSDDWIRPVKKSKAGRPTWNQYYEKSALRHEGRR